MDVSSDQFTNELFAARDRARPAARRDLEGQIVDRHLSLARSLALRFLNRGAERDDLVQVANFALVKAMRGFDAAKGAFVPFATASILGELKRHFRDQCWSVRPPRRLQELQARISRERADHWQAHCAEPTAQQLADALDEPLSEVREALAASGCYSATSLDVPAREDSQSLGDLLVDDHDPGYARVDDLAAVGRAVRDLDDSQRELIGLRFFDDLTQQQIADRTGVSQMQVSRRLSRLMTDLRDTVGPAAPAA